MGWTTYKLGFDGTLRPTIRKFGIMLKDGEVTVTHPTGEYTQMSESGLIHFIPQPIYTTSPLPANTEGFEGGVIPSGWDTSDCSIVTGGRTGNYCLRLDSDDYNSHWAVDFYVTKDNTTVSFWYRRDSTSVDQWSYRVALDGQDKGGIAYTNQWTQFTITGVSKGMHRLHCYVVDTDTYDYPVYFDDFTFEANPVAYQLIGYNSAVGYHHIYGTYIGEYTTSIFCVRNQDKP
ncbi:MAG: hypothetical protein ACPLTR_02945, partial [Thermacetogeniaceae bacterium]